MLQMYDLLVAGLDALKHCCETSNIGKAQHTRLRFRGHCNVSSSHVSMRQARKKSYGDRPDLGACHIWLRIQQSNRQFVHLHHPIMPHERSAVVVIALLSGFMLLGSLAWRCLPLQPSVAGRARTVVNSANRAASPSTMGMKCRKPIVQPAQDKHTASFIMLHGLGDQGDGWSEVAGDFTKALPHVKFIFPHAPTVSIITDLTMLL